ncbi:penicillopepsin [Trichodelitschia bisporula]|uniref:Penicillopepsin n=1 Tax=Trichodelitschia bisporula TaxID=703511 RepID=A0A6G1HKZ7_9PEZI|nr:penicillopepsin [Trichodelitschia bisporula]
MHTLTTLTLLASLLSLGSTSPTPALKKRSFEHHVRRQINRHPRSGSDALIKAYNKYGFTLTARQTSNSTRGSGAGAGNATGSGSSTGQVPAVPEPNDAEFLSPVVIGGQTLVLDFDTGSSDLWVFSTALSQRTIGGHAAFDPSKSTSFKAMTGASWQISYGDGSGAAGVVGMDVVNIGGATATRQAVELATAVSQSFVKDANNDGLVGLAFSQLNTVKPTKQTTFFDSIMPQLALPVFSVDLRNDSTGSYLFGAIDQSKFSGTLTNIPVNSASGFWQVTSPAIQIGNQRVATPNASPAIADTGTSLLLVDPQVATAYYKQVPGATNDATVGGFTYPCTSTLPDFGVALGNNYMAMIPGSEITFAQVDTGTCFGGVQSNGGAGLQIYGDVMFKTQYVVFDGGAKQLRVAPKKR